jgi:creatinine amidohydrolase
MILKNMTWREVDEIERSCVVLIPTGSLEQHGPALPLFTDTLLVTAVAEQIERQMPDRVLLTPTLWLGGSEHHMAFAGSLTNDLVAFAQSIESLIESLVPHGFTKFYVLNGHGGNATSISLALRNLKVRHRNLTFGSTAYYSYCDEVVAKLMEGPQKTLGHSGEAETSLVMHVAPELVRSDKLRTDGLTTEPPVRGLVSHFDEVTDEGVMGFARYATADKGKTIFEAAVKGVVQELSAIVDGYIFKS